LIKKSLLKFRIFLINKRTVKSAPTNRIYVFSGLLKCASCGKAMAGLCRPYGEREYYYYRCEQHLHRNTCIHSKVISEKKLEENLLNGISSYIDHYLVEYRTKNAAPNPLKTKRAKLTKKLEKLKDLYLNDLISMDEYRQDYNRYMER